MALIVILAAISACPDFFMAGFMKMIREGIGKSTCSDFSIYGT